LRQSIEVAMPNRSRPIHAVAALFFALPLIAAGAPPERGLRFDSPDVLDLATRSLKVADGAAVPVVQLPSEDAARIFAAAVVAEDPPALSFSEDAYACKPTSRKCSLRQEGALLSASGGAVVRNGKRLAIQPASGNAAVFIDWKDAPSKDADGDEETHWYLGRMPGSGYDRVEVQFGHDAPGNFLVNRQNGKTAFVHNGADLVAPAPDGRLLLTWNALNPPLSLRVAALDAAGPRLVLQCSASGEAEHLTPVFKGWHGDGAFDVVLEIGEQRKAMVRLALEASRKDGGWRLAAGDPGRLERIGLRCTQAESH
jgi:hypothetical protein